jgi:hypothetical protein
MTQVSRLPPEIANISGPGPAAAAHLSPPAGFCLGSVWKLGRIGCAVDF